MRGSLSGSQIPEMLTPLPKEVRREFRKEDERPGSGPTEYSCNGWSAPENPVALPRGV